VEAVNEALLAKSIGGREKATVLFLASNGRLVNLGVWLRQNVRLFYTSHSMAFQISKQYHGQPYNLSA
jgi:hypothetical protein